MRTKTQRKRNVWVATLTMVMVLLTLALATLPAYASGVMPAYAHCNLCSLDFYVLNGEAGAVVDYTTQTDSFRYIKFTVKIQKKVMGVFWRTVDIGETDNVWTYYSGENEGWVYKTFPISESGTYRAVFNIEFHGTNDVVDTISDTIQCTYTAP